MLRAFVSLCLSLCLIGACAGGSDNQPAAPANSEPEGAQPAPDITPIVFEQRLTRYVADGIPITGAIHYSVDLQAPQGALARASGQVRLTCTGCVLGDGVAKFFLGQPPRADSERDIGNFAAQGLTIPKIALGDIRAEILFTDGAGRVELVATGASDLHAEVRGDIALANDVGDSRVQLELVMKPEATLDPVARNLLLILPSTDASGTRFTIAGALTELRYLPRRTGTRSSRVAARPVSSTSPEDDTQPPAGTSADPPAGDTSVARRSSAGMSPEDMAKAITRRKDGTVVIAGELVEALLSNPLMLTGQARMVPSVKDGKSVGFKLYAMGPKSLYTLIGFRNGDTIVSVNGSSLASPEQALEVYQTVRTTDDIQVGVLRKGKPVTLRFEIGR